MEMNKFIMMMILLCGVMMQQALGQRRDSSCINRLLPCMNFLNGSRGNPPDSCCNPLKEIIEKMPECLCQMVSIKGSNAAEQAGINVNEAQMLPAKCGQPVNYMGCLRGASNSVGYSMSMGTTTSMKILLALASLILFQLL